MYDAREKAIRDRQWAMNAARREGKIEGEIKLIRTLQGILNLPPSDEVELRAMQLQQLESITSNLDRKGFVIGREDGDGKSQRLDKHRQDIGHPPVVEFDIYTSPRVNLAGNAVVRLR